MNLTDLIIGLGLGVLITLIVRAVNDARKEKALKQRKHLHEHTDLKGLIIGLNKDIEGICERLEKLESKRK